MNDDFNNQNNNCGYNPSGNIGNNTYITIQIIQQ